MERYLRMHLSGMKHMTPKDPKDPKDLFDTAKI
jgi:hypothetical protein